MKGYIKQNIVGLLVKTNLINRKAEIVKKFSALEIGSLQVLRDSEADKLLDYLRDTCEKMDRMRKKMLSLGYQMGYDVPRGDAQKRLDAREINRLNVSAWCESKYCKYPKPLHKMDPDELHEVVSQFEQVANDHKKKRA